MPRLTLLLLVPLQVVVISGDATIRSESDILTKDIFWVVQPDVSVTFEAPTVTLVRGSKEDKSGLVNTQEEDFLESAVMRAGNCSDDAIAAAEPVDGGGSEEEEAIKSVDLPPDPADALAESHADLTARRITSLTTDDDTQPASPMASADRSLPPGDSGTDSARPSSSPAAAADAGAKEPTPDHADRDDATTTPTHPATTDAAADGSTTPKAGSVFSAPAALSPHEANANDHAHAHAASLGEVSDDGDAHLTKLNGVVQSCDDFPAFSRGVMTLVDDLVCPRAKVVVISGDATIRSESDILTKDIFWVVQPGVSSSSSSISSSNSNSNEDDGNSSTSADEEQWRHPAAMLTGGERLTKVLVSPDGRCGLFRDRNDASLRFYRDAVSGPPPDYEVGGTNEEVRASTTLIRPDPRNMARVHRIRKEIAEEEDERALLGGEQAKKGFVRGLQRFLPWGKHSFRREWGRKHVINHLGEDYMTLTKVAWWRATWMAPVC
eukprot:g15645.t1